MNAQRALEVPGLRVGNHCTRPNFILEIAKNPWVSRGVGKMSVIRLRHTPAIISFQIVNDVFIKKTINLSYPSIDIRVFLPIELKTIQKRWSIQ